MIKGKRIYLRLIERSDINILYDICNDDSVAKYNNVLPKKKYLLNNFHIIRKSPDKILSIINEKGVIVGFMDYRSYSYLKYMIGITIGKKFWNRGYGQESIKVLLNYLFTELGAKEVVVEVVSENTRAIRCCQACGFYIKEINKNEDGINIVKMELIKGK